MNEWFLVDPCVERTKIDILGFYGKLKGKEWKSVVILMSFIFFSVFFSSGKSLICFGFLTHYICRSFWFDQMCSLNVSFKCFYVNFRLIPLDVFPEISSFFPYFFHFINLPFYQTSLFFRTLNCSYHHFFVSKIIVHKLHSFYVNELMVVWATHEHHQEKTKKNVRKKGRYQKNSKVYGSIIIQRIDGLSLRGSS